MTSMIYNRSMNVLTAFCIDVLPQADIHDEVGRYRDARYRADARPDSFVFEWRRACNECGLVHGLSACKQIVGRTTIVKSTVRIMK